MEKHVVQEVVANPPSNAFAAQKVAFNYTNTKDYYHVTK